MAEVTLTAVETPEGTPATVDQIAAVKFRAVRELRALHREGRAKLAHERLQELCPYTVIAVELLGLSKKELIERVATKGSFLMPLAHAADHAGKLKEILHSAEIRLAVALAVVEADDGGGDGGGGEEELAAA